MCPIKACTWGYQTCTLGTTSFDVGHSIFRGSQKQGGPGSVRFGYGLGMKRFERFRFSVPAVPLRRGFLCVSVQFKRERTVPVPVSVPGKVSQESAKGAGGKGARVINCHNFSSPQTGKQGE